MLESKHSKLALRRKHWPELRFKSPHHRLLLHHSYQHLWRLFRLRSVFRLLAARSCLPSCYPMLSNFKSKDSSNIQCSHQLPHRECVILAMARLNLDLVPPLKVLFNLLVCLLLTLLPRYPLRCRCLL